MNRESQALTSSPSAESGAEELSAGAADAADLAGTEPLHCPRSTVVAILAPSSHRFERSRQAGNSSIVKTTLHEITLKLQSRYVTAVTFREDRGCATRQRQRRSVGRINQTHREEHSKSSTGSELPCGTRSLSLRAEPAAAVVILHTARAIEHGVYYYFDNNPLPSPLRTEGILMPGILPALLFALHLCAAWCAPTDMTFVPRSVTAITAAASPRAADESAARANRGPAKDFRLQATTCLAH